MAGFQQLVGSARKVAGKSLRRAGLRTRSDLNQVAGGISALTARIDWLGQRVDALEQREQWHVNALADLRNRAAIDAVGRWLEFVTLREHPLVSVVTPTKDRPDQLERAIRSVVAQRYENWELLVDDGGRDGSRAVVDAIGDQRIKWTRSPEPGETAGRNHALRLANGELIAYLDDDNIMDPNWLYAVVWAFEQRPDIDVLYGAHVIDDYLRARGDTWGALPAISFSQWSREALRRGNLTDMSAIAHRAGLPEGWFDPDVDVAPDWDLLLRLTAEKDPLMLPVIACFYTTDAPNRISASSTFGQRLEAVAARARSS